MGRKSREELQEICNQLGVKTLWSWSRYNTYKQDPYSYMLKYILKIPEDRHDGIYGASGSIAHECIEDFYSKEEFTHQDMLDKYENALFDFEMAGLKYNRSDDDKNMATAKKYETCLKHFFLNHQRIPYKPKIEQFITIKVGKYIFQGYIDFFHVEKINNKNVLVITDWKTSSVYKGEKVNKEKGQLILYAQGLMQKTGVPIDNIIIRWNFLKYVEVEYTQAKGDTATRIIERHEIASKLKANVKMWLKKSKYDELEIENYLEQMDEYQKDLKNPIDCLPKDIQDKFKVKDCYVQISLNQEVINELNKDIITTLDEITQKEKEYTKTKDENLFWKDVTKENSFFFANLSGYSRIHHKPYNAYLEELEMFNKKEDTEEEDLSWLDEL